MKFLTDIFSIAHALQELNCNDCSMSAFSLISAMDGSLAYHLMDTSLCGKKHWSLSKPVCKFNGSKKWKQFITTFWLSIIQVQEIQPSLVSEWIAENARSKGMNVHVASFNKFNPADIAHFEGKTLIGFFSATHGFNMPHSMIAFMLRFKELRGSDTFIGNTLAGMKLWKLFMPGLSGIAMYFPALIMLLKGYKVKAMYPVDLPSNWISLHPGWRRKIVDSMVVHCNSLVNHFADRVLNGGRVYLRSLVLALR